MRHAAIAVSALLASTALSGAQAETFTRIASFPVAANLPEGTDAATVTSSEIIAASEDGMTLVYSDSPLGAVGFIDITDPRAPKAGGAVALEGEPTSVAISGGTVFVGVNTSESYTEPSGVLRLIDIASREVTESCDLGGQPDSVAVAPDGSFLAIAIENERDEEVNDGAIPQLPGGFVAIIPLGDGGPQCDAMVRADVTGLADIAPEDPEPEFVDINTAGEIAVTLQENNHVAILSRTGEVLSHFSAGEVTLEGADVTEEDAISFDGTVTMKREPDAVKWVGDRLAVANEGDLEGGSRGFTIFERDGTVAYESGLSFEYAIAAAGHYPEGRSENKGVEPEGLATGTFGDETLLFVLSERGSMVGVYRVGDGEPELLQLLPSGVGPEGAVAIPSRNLFVTANETDLVEDGLARSHVMIYERGEQAAQYPTIVSATVDGAPIGWGALSGLAADPSTAGRLYAVSDSVYVGQPAIFTIDATTTPATITAKTVVTEGGAPAEKLDIEGIALDGSGGFWLASEGRTDREIPHRLVRVDAAGAIVETVPFPEALLAGETRFGAEGVTMIGDTLWIAIQREWGDDAEGTVKLVAYNTADKSWGAVRYPLEPKGEGWMGLSEIAAHGDHVYLIERDNLIGDKAKVKMITRVPVAELQPAPLGGELSTVSKEVVRDLIPDLQRWGGYVVDKVEGLTIAPDGTAWIVTDNDGVDDSSGETLFWSVSELTN